MRTRPQHSRRFPYYLPASQGNPASTAEYDARRLEAEAGSRRLAAAIERYFEKRAQG